MAWKIPKMWKDGECWILGGGSSVPRLFGVPDSIINKVSSGEESPSLYSPYLSAIHGKHVIGINMAYKIGPWIDILFFGDTGFFRQHRISMLTEYKGLVVTCASGYDRKSFGRIKQLNRAKNHYGLCSNPDFVSWNMNSGSAAINFAIHLGAKRIILLGFDMNQQGGKTHWHNIYGNNPKSGTPFTKHLRGFPEIARDADRMGIEILNTSPESAITVFKKVTIEECLKRKK